MAPTRLTRDAHRFAVRLAALLVASSIDADALWAQGTDDRYMVASAAVRAFHAEQLPHREGLHLAPSDVVVAYERDREMAEQVAARLGMRPAAWTAVHVCAGPPNTCRLVDAALAVEVAALKIRGDSARVTLNVRVFSGSSRQPVARQEWSGRLMRLRSGWRVCSWVLESTT